MDNGQKIVLDNNPSVVEVMLDRFHAWGVTTLFVIPGVHIHYLLIQAAKDSRFQIIMAAHEQGAGYMADGYARISGGPGIVITINGPGANNLTTAAVTAKVDHSPVLFLTGDTPSVVQGFGAFQCSDPEGSNSSAIFQEALKYSFCISTPETLSSAFQLFEEILDSHSPSPMHINLPSDIAKRYLMNWTNTPHVSSRKDNDIEKTPTWLEKIPATPGNRAAILVGEEVKDVSEIEAIAEFSKRFAIPVACTLAAKNIQAFLAEELFLGVFGYAGGPRAFEAILDPQLETLIVLGAILDERNTVAWHENFFQPTRKIFRFSSDLGAVRKYPVPIVEVIEGPSKAINWLQHYWDESDETHPIEYENRVAWSRTLQEISQIPRVARINSNPEAGMSMITVVSIMNETLPMDTTLFLDSGDHRIYGGTFWEVGARGSFFTAAQTAPMGWAIGAAIGASFSKKNKQIWVITGDGCMLMHGMEISVAAKYKCQVVFLVSNNGSYARVAARMRNEPETLRKTLSSLPAVSWSDFAHSMGVPSRCVSTIGGLTEAIQEAKDSIGPFLIEVITNYEAECPFPPAIVSSSSPGFAENWKTHKSGK